jgi:SAM-dependent methyltransferase
VNQHIFREKEDGLEFVGDFDSLYGTDQDPWQQGADRGEMAAYYEHSRSFLIDTLCSYLNSGARGLEVGCGHGHLTRRLNYYFRMTGMDISRTAVDFAKRQNNGIYVQGDIIRDKFDQFGPFRFVVWGQILWYVLHEIDRAIENTMKCLEPGGLFIVSQAFLREQKYGKEIADGFLGTLDLFRETYSDRLTLLHASYDDEERYVHHDGLLIFRYGG